ncbi:MAG: mandelate racemase/muconate lactonizing enzyme family protein [Caldilineaceae bacterium]
MNITKIETLCLSRLHEPKQQWITARYRTIKADCAIVVIHTDEGYTGIGEASAYGWPLLIRDWVKWLAPALVGKDPRDPAIVPHPNGRARPYDCAVAGIDCALWDLRAKIQGERVSTLLSATPKTEVRLYASSGCRYDWRLHPDQLVEEALGYMDQGYSAMKLRMGTEWHWDNVTVDRFLGLMREVTEAVNGRMELMLDGNQRLNVDDALIIAQELEWLGFTWFEEPIPQTDLEGYAKLNAAVDMPITGGEQFATLEQFRPYFEKKAYGVVQPDAGIAGITECLRIAAAAERYGVDFTPHSWHNGLMCMAHAHMMAALPFPRPVELCMIQGPLQWQILADPPLITKGKLLLPDAPGFGVQLAENLEDKFPYIEGHYAVTVER